MFPKVSEKGQDELEIMLHAMVSKIVNNPDDVRIESAIDDRGLLFTLHVNPLDMGYVIGKKGQTAQAIRTLLRAAGAKREASVSMKVFDPRPEGQIVDPGLPNVEI